MPLTPRARPPCPAPHRRQRTTHEGFTLIELAIVLLGVALLAGGLLMPLSTQYEQRKVAETRQLLEQARQALIGFAAANGRLPCPASDTSNGQESFAAGGDASNGNCSNYYDGFLPAAALGLSPTDQNGFALDAWAQPQNRLRYAVFSGTINSVSAPFTRSNGMRNATMSEISSATLLSVCATATGITGSGCGSATALSSRTPAVIFSLGKNAASGGAAADEAANLNNNRVFVFHDPTPADAANGEFDDVATWLSLHVLFNLMIAAGQLP